MYQATNICRNEVRKDEKNLGLYEKLKAATAKKKKKGFLSVCQ